MVDIAKCQDDACPSRWTCYRYIASTNAEWQAWSVFDRAGRDKCDSYWPVDKDPA